MRISHKHKFVFIALPKSGTGSIRKALDEYSDIKSVDAPPEVIYNNNEWVFGNHIKARVLKKHFEDQNWQWSDYFKFVFVRNPWNRIVSLYKWEMYRNRFEGSFEKFLDNYLKDNYRSLTNRSGLETGIFTDSNNNCLVDFVGRFENLQEDFDIICDNIGIQRQQLIHTHKSKHKHYTEYYDDEMQELIRRRYENDKWLSSYKFGD